MFHHLLVLNLREVVNTCMLEDRFLFKLLCLLLINLHRLHRNLLVVSVGNHVCTKASHRVARQICLNVILHELNLRWRWSRCNFNFFRNHDSISGHSIN